MKKITLFLFVLGSFMLLIMAIGCSGNESSKKNGQSKKIKIGILYTEPHPVLTTIIDAFKARIKESIPDVEFIERHGSGSKAQYPSVVRALIAEEVDLLAPITTPMSIETFKQARNRIPVVFLGVTDPLGAGLVDSLIEPNKCSGVSDNPPMEGVVNLVMLYLPKAKKIGIPYDPKDQPGVTTAKRAAASGEALGLSVELRPVTSESELRAVIRSLASNVEAIIIGMDNLMMKNAGIISRTAKDQKIPLFAADDKSVEMGAIAGVGVDYSDVGKLGADIAVKILKDGKTVGTIPVETLRTGQIFYNREMSRSLNIPIPKKVEAEGKPVRE